MRWIHLVGMALFIGAGLAAGVVNRMAFEEGAHGKSMDWVQWNLGRLANGGAVLLYASGAVALFFEGWNVDALSHQGWLILMVALAMGASAFNLFANQHARKLFDAPPATEAEASNARMVIFKLRIGFLVANLAAIASGIWRFTI
jgi:hypothetical protein